MDMTHIDEKGQARMVSISGKYDTKREAIACGRVFMKETTMKLLTDGQIPKGDVIAAARIAGIMAAKHTQDLIPLCHNITLDAVDIHISADFERHCIYIEAKAGCTGKTGVEMEALTAVSVAALTVYDMCKAVDKEMTISDIMLLKKTGGKSGEYIRHV